MNILKGIISLAMSLTILSTALIPAMQCSAASDDLLSSRSPIKEPYEYVNGGSFSGDEQKYSPDPLVSYRWDKVSADDKLQIFLMQPSSASTETPDSFTGMDTLTTDNVAVKVTGEGTIMLDFGRELAGWFEVDIPNLSGDITLGVSEYNEPAFVNSGPKSPSKTAKPVKYGDTYRLELNDELYEGARFAFINVESFDKPFDITGLRMVCQVKPANYNGSFNCDNEMLNKIWYAAAYDVRANLKEDYFAAILVDRGDRHSWTGDAYTAQAAALPAFANYDFVLENLHYTSVRSNGIESYEMYWIFSLIDYYEYTGDKAGVEGLLSQALSRLDHAYDIYGTNPQLGFFGWDERLGAGFENPNIQDNQESYKLLSIQAWRDFSKILRDLGKTDLAEKYEGYAVEKLAEIAADADWYKDYSMHTAADAINAGVLEEDALNELSEKYFTDRLNRLSYSPFNQYFILQAMGEAGYYDDAIQSILDLWGGQIEYGGTTFFETFRPDWATELETNSAVPNNQAGFTSLAHPWSAGVLAWMSEEILGIKAETPGFKTFTVTPHLGRQLNMVSGEMPTPYGTITASFDVETGTHTVSVPEGTEATVGIPKTERKIIEIKQNGKKITADREDEDFVYITGLSTGDYSFSVTYEGETPEYIVGEYEYTAQFVGSDTETKGNWGGVYGGDGYVLCNYGSGSDRILPDYVSNVRFSKAASQKWTDDTDDERALAGNCYNIGTRRMNGYRTNNDNACYQTFTVDIELPAEHEYTVALYFVDWDKEGRELAIEMFDGETLNLAAPVKVVEDYTGGVYMIYKYNKSARFRIDQIRGSNAVLSGVFFGGEGSSDAEYVYKVTDDTDSNIVYSGGSWNHDPMGGAYNDTFSYSKNVGASAEYTFTGDNISYLASKEFNRGMVEVFLDGESQGIFDLYSQDTRRQERIFTASGLSDTEHTIKIVVTGNKNPLATDSFVDVDGFEFKSEFNNLQTVSVDNADSKISYVGGSWNHDPIGGAYNGTFSYSKDAGAYAEYTFTGAGVTLISSKESNRGIAEIFVDGVSQGTVDLYSPDIKRQQNVFEISDLPVGEHTIRVVVTGNKNSSASDCYVDIDAFQFSSEIFTLENVSEILKIKTPNIDDTSIKLPAVPKGFELSVKMSSHPDIVSLDGNITLPDTATDVTLTLLLTHNGDSLEKTVTVSIPAAEPKTLPGDIDKNGTVNVADMMALKNLIMSGSWTDEQLSIGDMDNNKTLNVADMIAIKSLIMSKAS